MFFILKKRWSFLSILPNKKTIEFIGRYVNIGRFDYYRKQAKLFDRLKQIWKDVDWYSIICSIKISMPISAIYFMPKKSCLY
jgi:hypothetical protein